MSGQTDSTPGRENTSFDPFALYLGAGRYSENSYNRAHVAQARDRDRDSRMPLVLSWKSIDGFDMNHFEHVAKPQRPAGVFRRRRAGRRYFWRPTGHVRRGAGPERPKRARPDLMESPRALRALGGRMKGGGGPSL